MALSKRVLVLLAGLTFPAAASAQTITTLVETGTVLTGIGTVINVNGFAVDDSGHVLVVVRTDNPNPLALDALLDEQGNVIAYAGQALAQPSGAAIRSFNGGDMTMSSQGSSTFSLWLAGTTGLDDDGGIYLGTSMNLLVQESNVSTAPQLPAGTIFRSILYPKINDSGLICSHMAVDDPTIPGMYDTPALFVFDTVAGTQSVVAKRGDILPGQTWGISDFGWNRHQLAFNNAGHVMYIVGTYDNPNISANIYLDYTKIAQKSDVSPFGSAYIQFLSVSLNSQSNYLIGCRTNDPNGEYGIVSNGAGFVQFGDSLPDIEPFQLNYIGTPLFLGDDGRIAWGGTWNSPAGPQGTGIFVDYTLLVSVGATTIHGSTVQDLTMLDGSFTLSPSGQYLVFQATLTGGVIGAYMIDLWQ